MYCLENIFDNQLIIVFYFLAIGRVTGSRKTTGVQFQVIKYFYQIDT